jgi:hypothetical protein
MYFSSDKIRSGHQRRRGLSSGASTNISLLEFAAEMMDKICVLIITGKRILSGDY